MTLSPRKFAVIKFVAESGVTNTPRVRNRLYPDDKDGSTARRELNELFHRKLVNKSTVRVVEDGTGNAPTVYYPAPLGLQELAMTTGDMRWLGVCTNKPFDQHLQHFLALGDMRMKVIDAVNRQSIVSLAAYFNEYDVVNNHAHRHEPEKRFKLYTLIHEKPKRLPCAPDGLIVLKIGEQHVCYYVELERGTSKPNDVAKTKAPGYHELARLKLHLRHYPGAIDALRVLVVAPHCGWRDSLRAAFAEQKSPELYRFAAWPELTDSLLFDAVWYDHKGEARPLVKRPEQAKTPSATGSERGERSVCQGARGVNV